MASEALLEALAKALSQPSRAYRTAQAALDIPNQALAGYLQGGEAADKIRKRKLSQQTLLDALGGQVPRKLTPFANLTAEQVEPFSPLLKHGFEDESSFVDDELKRDYLRARIDSLRNPPEQKPRPMDPLDRKLKEVQLEKEKRGPGSEKSIQDAYSLYKTAKEGLLSGLGGSVTGPVVGRIPAFTAKQQIAKGSVAAMAPVLKQLFRVAGEGIFSDRDQQILLDMIPTRVEEPEARAAMIQNIDNIVKAKLGISDGEGGSSKGTKIKVSNGKETREIDPLDIPNAMKDGYKPVP